MGSIRKNIIHPFLELSETTEIDGSKIEKVKSESKLETETSEHQPVAVTIMKREKVRDKSE